MARIPPIPPTQSLELSSSRGQRRRVHYPVCPLSHSPEPPPGGGGGATWHCPAITQRSALRPLHPKGDAPTRHTPTPIRHGTAPPPSAVHPLDPHGNAPTVKRGPAVLTRCRGCVRSGSIAGPLGCGTLCVVRGDGSPTPSLNALLTFIGPGLRPPHVRWTDPPTRSPQTRHLPPAPGPHQRRSDAGAIPNAPPIANTRPLVPVHSGPGPR